MQHETNWRIVKAIAWQLTEANEIIHKDDVTRAFAANHPDRKVINVSMDLQMLSVNARSRLSYLYLFGKVNPQGVLRNQGIAGSEAEYPRLSSLFNEKDVLLALGNSRYRRYNPIQDGIYFIELDAEQVNHIRHIKSDDFEQQIAAASQLSSAQRHSSLMRSNEIPERVDVMTSVFRRDPNVVAERLALAGGYCDDCHQPAPFLRRSDQSPYLEVHHILPLAEFGSDTLDNTVALCPNCHRKRHLG